MKEENFPPIDKELLPKAKKRLDLKSLQSPNSMNDDQIAQNSTEIGKKWGAQTTIAIDQERTLLASLRIMVPAYLDNQLTQSAAKQRVTKRFLILKALSEAGYHIRQEDLITDKRKKR